MPRTIPPARFDALVRAATLVFLRQGYRRTQMSDVAAELGVAKGTLYLYVESKEALFEQALLHADRAAPISLPRALPIPTPRPGSTLRRVRQRVVRESALPELAAALARRKARDSRVEAEAIVRELVRLLASHRVAIKLFDRCAPDFPELAALWFSAGRSGVVALLEQYLRKRIAARQFAAVKDPALAARLVLELVAYWAVHRHWDPAPNAAVVSDELAEAAAIEFVSRALHGDLP